MTGAWRYTTVDCVRVWRFYAHVGPTQIVRTTALACIRAGALALPLALPGAAFLPPMPHGGVVFGGPIYSGPAYEIGPVFGAGFYGVPASLATTQELGANLKKNNALTPVPIAQELGQSTTPMMSGDVPHWLPDRDVPGQSVPPTEVPEPASVVLLAAALIIVMLRRWAR